MSNTWGQVATGPQRCAVHLPGDHACDDTCWNRLDREVSGDRTAGASSTLGPDDERDMATAGVDRVADAAAEAEQLARLGDVAG